MPMSWNVLRNMLLIWDLGRNRILIKFQNKLFFLLFSAVSYQLFHPILADFDSLALYIYTKINF